MSRADCRQHCSLPRRCGWDLAGTRPLRPASSRPRCRRDDRTEHRCRLTETLGWLWELTGHRAYEESFPGFTGVVTMPPPWTWTPCPESREGRSPFARVPVFAHLVPATPVNSVKSGGSLPLRTQHLRGLITVWCPAVKERTRRRRGVSSVSRHPTCPRASLLLHPDAVYHSNQICPGRFLSLSEQLWAGGLGVRGAGFLEIKWGHFQYL